MDRANPRMDRMECTCYKKLCIRAEYTAWYVGPGVWDIVANNNGVCTARSP